MKKGVAAALLLALVSPRLAGAFDLSGESRSFLRSSESFDKRKLLPAYEYLDFKIDNLTGADTLSFHFGGWGRYDLAGASSSRRDDTFLQYAYLKIRGETGNGQLSLGRVPVMEGIVNELLDGVYGRTELAAGFEFAAFGGLPVIFGLEDQYNNLVYGGRLSQGKPELYRVGVSWLKEQNNGKDLREEIGVDLWSPVMKSAELSGRSIYNLSKSGFKEHDYNLNMGPFAGFRINGKATWVDYDQYFASATGNVFKLQTGIIEPGEKVLILGSSADYRLMSDLSIIADYRNFNYSIADSADYFGGRLVYLVADSGGGGLAYHRMNGSQDRLRYNEFRMYLVKNFAEIDAALDVISIQYDRKINEVDNAYDVILAVGYNFAKTLRLAVDLDYGHTPDFDNDFKLFLKCQYKFGASEPVGH